MSFWDKVKDWILGFNYIDKPTFDKKMDELKDSIGSEIDKIKANIDSNSDGMVSVRETYSLIKSCFKMMLKMIKAWF